MRITAVKPHPVRIATRNQMLVKIETDEGIYGWGESGFIGREIAVAGAVRHFASFLEGRDPMRRGALWQEMYRSQYFEGGRTLTAAISAIDIALHDIARQEAGRAGLPAARRSPARLGALLRHGAETDHRRKPRRRRTAAAPRLGIEVDEAALAGEFDFVEPPHLHRADGSHTNA